MDDKTLSELKATLKTEADTLQQDLMTIATLDETTGDWVALPETQKANEADENVEADRVENWNERRATLAQLETRYRNVVRALEKITAGTYGMCELSGEPIELERLQANPAARTNIANREREHELPR